mmetsp:Transcript_2412/g.3407  ORF Transcript_2412/g.3407 Transcript_2412/m.3407 type:complete len:685 (+) Transcript_2412:241-2295(+)
MDSDFIPTGADVVTFKEEVNRKYGDVSENPLARDIGKKHLGLSESAKAKMDEQSYLDAEHMTEAERMKKFDTLMTVLGITERFQKASEKLAEAKRLTLKEMFFGYNMEAEKVEQSATKATNPSTLFKESESHITIAIYSGSVPKVDFVGSCDPFVKIVAGKKTAKTEAISDCLDPKWFQLFMLKIDNYFTRDSPIVLEVYDQDAMNRSKYLGKCEFKADEIDGREIESPFYGGKNPSSMDMDDVQGTVIVQLAKVEVIAKDFKQGMLINMEYLQELEDLNNRRLQMVPLPRIPQNMMEKRVRSPRSPGSPGYVKDQVEIIEGLNDDRPLEIFKECDTHFSIAIMAAFNLPKMDDIGYCDGFVTLLGEKKIQTKVEGNKQNPRWDQLFCIVAKKEDQMLTFQLSDHNKFSQDEIFGHIEIPVYSVRGQIQELPIFDDDGKWRGTLQVQIVRAKPKDSFAFKQGMFIEPEVYQELALINRRALASGSLNDDLPRISDTVSHASGSEIDLSHEPPTTAEDWQQEVLYTLCRPLPGELEVSSNVIKSALRSIKRFEEEVDKLSSKGGKKLKTNNHRVILMAAVLAVYLLLCFSSLYKLDELPGVENTAVENDTLPSMASRRIKGVGSLVKKTIQKASNITRSYNATAPTDLRKVKGLGRVVKTVVKKASERYTHGTSDTAATTSSSDL